MSAMLDSKHRRGRKAFIERLHTDPKVGGLDKGIANDLPLLRSIDSAPNGWHPEALDRFHRTELIKRGHLVLTKTNRLVLTPAGKAAIRQG